MGYNSIIFECHDDVALITLNRPQTLNALNAEIRGELSEATGVVRQDDDIRALLFRNVRELLFNVIKHAQVTR